MGLWHLGQCLPLLGFGSGLDALIRSPLGWPDRAISPAFVPSLQPPAILDGLGALGYALGGYPSILDKALLKGLYRFFSVCDAWARVRHTFVMW